MTSTNEDNDSEKLAKLEKCLDDLKKLYELIRQQKEWLDKTCHTI